MLYRRCQRLVVIARSLWATYLSQSLETLLLGVRVDICADDEADEVEERHPRMFRQESLRKGERQGRGDPADLHYWHETGPDGRADLVESPGARNHGHATQIDRVLNRGDLRLCNRSATAVP